LAIARLPSIARYSILDRDLAPGKRICDNFVV
jgi:hypothetical protein